MPYTFNLLKYYQTKIIFKSVSEKLHSLEYIIYLNVYMLFQYFFILLMNIFFNYNIVNNLLCTRIFTIILFQTVHFFRFVNHFMTIIIKQTQWY